MGRIQDVYKPTKIQVIAPIIVLIVTLVSGGIMLSIANKLGVENEKTNYLAPGTINMTLEPGNYTLYLMTEADYQGKHYSIPKDFDKLTYSISFNDQVLKMGNPENDYSFGEGQYQGKTLKTFNVTEKGDYQLETAIEDENVKQLVVAVGKTDKNIQAVITLTIIAAMIILMGVLQFAGYLILNVGKILYYQYKKKMDA